VVFDEIHQLRDPARLLKIGADAFPKFKILATGSSTLGASKKFRDTLTGRKRTIHLVPVLWEELAAFGVTLNDRLFHGGLPPALLADAKNPAFYREWMDSFFARGWDPLRPGDFGVLWEHFVLEHLQAHFPDTPVRYWRDKAQREIDFVLAHRRDVVDVIECKWDPAGFDVGSLRVFRGYYPKGRNYLVTPSGDPAYTRRFGTLEVRVCTPTELHA
jgi:predicted AAA+ superfamily ATPase